MSSSCPECGASMPDIAAFCPGCGQGIPPIDRVQGNVGAMPRTIAGALAYCTIIPAIIFLVVEPYNRDRFVRFHSFQCIGFWLAALVIGAVVRAVAFLLFFVPLLGYLVVLLLSMVTSLGLFAIWVVLIVKALQGEIFKLPLVGNFAEQHAATN
ncbi:MAG: zinc-ribbon domain-containing protein [Candidatus Sulfotelmatobacter sp.]